MTAGGPDAGPGAEGAPRHLRAWATSLLPPGTRGQPAAQLHSLCTGASTALRLQGAAIELRSTQGAEAVAASSDDRALVLARISLDMGEGPTWEAYERGHPVLVSDLGGREGARWVAYGPSARAAGIGAVFAFPLQVGAARFGVLTAFDSAPRHLDAVEINRCLAVAEVATGVLLDSAEESADGEIDPHLKSALGFRSEVYQAQGMVAAALTISLVSAMARMRAHAFATDRDLTQVALDIVQRRLRLEDDLPDPHDPTSARPTP